MPPTRRARCTLPPARRGVESRSSIVRADAGVCCHAWVGVWTMAYPDMSGTIRDLSSSLGGGTPLQVRGERRPASPRLAMRICMRTLRDAGVSGNQPPRGVCLDCRAWPSILPLRHATCGGLICSLDLWHRAPTGMPPKQPTLGSLAVQAPSLTPQTVHVTPSTCHNLSTFKGA